MGGGFIARVVHTKKKKKNGRRGPCPPAVLNPPPKEGVRHLSISTIHVGHRSLDGI